MQCSKCKRHLEPTMHTRSGYKVEAYMLHTGSAVPVIMLEESDEEKKFMKIEDPRIVTICDKCIKKAEVKKAIGKFEAPSGV